VLKKVGNWCGAGVGRIIEDDLVFAGTASAFSRSNIRQLVPGAVRDTLGDYWGRRKMTNSVGEAMLFDLRQRLPDDIFMRTDRATMAASIESRVPFVDPRLIRWSLSIDDALKVDGTESKVLVKRAASRYLPHGLIYRPKIGFDLPIDRWLRGVFRNEIYEFVSDRKIPGLRYGGVMDLVIGWERSSSPSVKASQVWFWFALERWYRTWIG
jgi:asparagine synthase (glutamine-hydrolysing)